MFGEDQRRVDLVLVCSAGGHLLQLLALRAAWEPFSRIWVTLEAEDSVSLLADERVSFAHGPTIRNVHNLVRNVHFAWRLLRSARPSVIVTTGAALAVPFAFVGRLLGIPTVYIESLSRIDRPSLSYRLVAPVLDRSYVQWPELVSRMPRARFAGSVISDPE